RVRRPARGAQLGAVALRRRRAAGRSAHEEGGPLPHLGGSSAAVRGGLRDQRALRRPGARHARPRHGRAARDRLGRGRRCRGRRALRLGRRPGARPAGRGSSCRAPRGRAHARDLADDDRRRTLPGRRAVPGRHRAPPGRAHLAGDRRRSRRARRRAGHRARPARLGHAAGARDADARPRGLAAAALAGLLAVPDARRGRGRRRPPRGRRPPDRRGGHPMNGMAPVLAQSATAADFSNDTILVRILKGAAILVFLLLSVLFAIWFERRLVARFQQRIGPNWNGPQGLLQSLADAMKLLLKEDITVKAADKIIYLVAPIISVFCAFMVFAVIPFGPEVSIFGVVTPLQMTDFPVAVLYILGITALGVYGIVLGGWASGSTYPLLGAVRSTAQVISYELAMSLALVSV